MSIRSLAVFFAGFVAGLVFLSVLLRETGMLRPIAASAATGRPKESQTPAQSPDPPRSRLSAGPSHPPPASPNDATPSPMDRRLTERRLIIPVQGVHAGELRDNFDEMHSGHRHEAIDIMAPRGTPVLAADDGPVVKLFLSKPGGLTVYQFDASQTFCYYYAHLDAYALGLKEGAGLRKGDVLGFVGSTGNASPDSPHLHFAIFELGRELHWWEGTPVDPFGYLDHSR